MSTHQCKNCRFRSFTLICECKYSAEHLNITGKVPHNSRSPAKLSPLSLSRPPPLSLYLPLSPTLFNIFYQKHSFEGPSGTVTIVGRTITDLRFADDIDAIVEDKQQLTTY